MYRPEIEIFKRIVQDGFNLIPQNGEKYESPTCKMLKASVFPLMRKQRLKRRIFLKPTTRL